jgi:hypothetical protein
VITIKRDGTKLVLLVEDGMPNVEGGALKFEWDTGREVLAAALTLQLQRHVEEVIGHVRRLEYEAGWKDARARTRRGNRKPKRTWFFSTLRREVP